MTTQSSGVAAAPPRISQVIGGEGNIIAQGATDIDTQITLKGNAEIATVEIFDNGKFVARTSVSGGAWTQSIAVTIIGQHVLTAKSYDGQLVSGEWRYTVRAPQGVMITSVTDEAGKGISNGGTTSSTTIKLSGTAEPNRTLDIMDNKALKGTVKVLSNGNWSLELKGLAAKLYSFNAVGTHGYGTASTARTLTVLSGTTGVEDFEVDKDVYIDFKKVTLASGLGLIMLEWGGSGNAVIVPVSTFPEFGKGYLYVTSGTRIRIDFKAPISRLKVIYLGGVLNVGARLIFRRTGGTDYDYPLPIEAGSILTADLSLPGLFQSCEVDAGPRRPLEFQNLLLGRLEWS